MHDLHIANKLLSKVLEEAKKNNLKKIFKIKINLGRVTEHNEEITPENLKFNIQLLAKNTIAEMAQVKIVRKNSRNIVKLEEISGI